MRPQMATCLIDKKGNKALKVFYLFPDYSLEDTVLARVGSREVVGIWHSCSCGEWIIMDTLAIEITGGVPFDILGRAACFREFKPQGLYFTS